MIEASESSSGSLKPAVKWAAVKARAVSSAVLVDELTAEGPVAGMVTLRVTDQGCGMDEATRARIFDPYFTTKEFGEEVRGFGLGLTIAQRIAHLHHGRITVASRPGAGTTLTVDLPVDPAAVPVAA